jgi:hypothetical protein
MKMTNELFVESRPIKLRVEMALRGQKNAMREQGRDGYGEKKRTCSIAGKSKKMDE